MGGELQQKLYYSLVEFALALAAVGQSKVVVTLSCTVLHLGATAVGAGDIKSCLDGV